jgi:glycosyltransferase involved in cell wall biosynthesis
MISVIVAAYDEPELLEAVCTRLILQNHDGKWEIIVCDDGSSADMLSRLRKLSARNDVELRYVWQTNRGFRAAASRNNGIAIAKGELLIFIDGDILVNRDFLTGHSSMHDGSERIVCGWRSTITIASAADVWNIDDCRLPDLSDEARGQMEWNSTVPWMTMLGCNFSVPSRKEVSFDNHLVGWGGDDRDLAIKLVLNHGYVACFNANACGIHVEYPGKSGANPGATRRQEDIVAFIRNKLYLLDKYPDFDLEPTTKLLLWCRLDGTTGTWRLERPSERRSLASAVETARQWMLRNGVPLIPP